MNFPKDQELFKDIRSDGTLDPDKFPKGRKTAKQAFYDEVLRHRNDPLSVWYKDSRSGDEEGIALILSLIPIIHYFIDGFGNYVRWRIQDFKDWCDKDAQENYRRLRFLILWYRNITGEKNTPFDAMEREFFATLAKRKEF